MGDPDEDVQEQAFNVVRNLTESEDGIAMVFKKVGREVLSCVMAGLSSGNDDDVLKEGIFTFSFYDFLKERYLLTPYTRSPRQPLYSLACRMEYPNNEI